MDNSGWELDNDREWQKLLCDLRGRVPLIEGTLYWLITSTEESSPSWPSHEAMMATLTESMGFTVDTSSFRTVQLDGCMAVHLTSQQ